MAKDKEVLIDCPYYKEGKHGNCWQDDGWDNGFCNVPGRTYNLCDSSKNGWRGKTFVAKVGKDKLQKYVEDYIFSEMSKPENFLVRIEKLEAKIEKLLS